MIYLFGAVDCEKCNTVKAGLVMLRLPFIFVDANADENQKIADNYQVDQLPHLVILGDAGTITEQYVGDNCANFIVSKARM